VFRGLGPEDFPYDHGKLTRTIYKEFERNNFLGCECEPNAIFVYCNQFPMLGFKHYDLTHGTDYAVRTIPAFEASWRKRSTMFGNDASSDLPIFYRKRQDDFIYEESNENNEGITAVTWASVMHAWARDYVERVYPKARDQILRPMSDGTVGVKLDGYFEKYKAYQKNPGHHATDPMMVGVHIFGTLALAAAEVGDASTLDGLLANAENHMRPAWKNGGYFYLRNDDLGSDGYTTALVGNALLAGARLCPKDGFWKLYNEPWDKADFERPELCEVDFPSVLVREARYLDASRTLRMVLAPGRETDEPRRVSVARLDLSRTHVVQVDGRDVLTIGGERTRAAEGEVSAEADRDAKLLRLAFPMRKETELCLRPA
jgi:hypothetical protein